LQVNCVYKKGSTGKITYDLHRGLLEAGDESVVCYGRGALVGEPDVYKTCSEWYSKLNNAWSRLTGIVYGGCFFSTRRLIRILERERPDIVHLQCINGHFVNIYRLVNWLKKNHVKTVLTLHAEFMYTGGCEHSVDCIQWSTDAGCGHPRCPRCHAETKSWLFDGTGTMWRRMKDAFEGFDENLTVVSVSPWLLERAKRAPVFKGKKQCLVQNGVDTSVFCPRSAEACRKERSRLGIPPEKKVVFHATPFFSLNPDSLKGGYYIAKLAECMPEVQFVVAGKCCREENLPGNLTLLGDVQDQNRLGRLYSMADVTVLASRRETFSMVTAESLCCGTPVVGFEAGAPEQIALPQYSEFCMHGRVELLKDAVYRMSGRSFSKQEMAREARHAYGRDIMVKAYRECYSSLVRADGRTPSDEG